MGSPLDLREGHLILQDFAKGPSFCVKAVSRCMLAFPFSVCYCLPKDKSEPISKCDVFEGLLFNNAYSFFFVQNRSLVDSTQSFPSSSKAYLTILQSKMAWSIDKGSGCDATYYMRIEAQLFPYS